MAETGASQDRATLPWSLRTETARLKTLIEECRVDGIPNPELAPSLRAVRVLVERGQYREALERLRELKLELLARMLIEESGALPAGPAENESPAGLPPEGVLSALNKSPDRRPSPGRTDTPR